MKTLLTTVKLSESINAHHVYLARYDVTRQHVVLSLLHSRKQLPLMTPVLRMLALALQALCSSGANAANPTPADITGSLATGDATSKVAATLIRHANIAAISAKVVENLSLQQQLKFVQSIIDRSKLAEQLLRSSGAFGEDGQFSVTPEMIIDLCHNARGAGPEDSELVAVRVIRAWIAAADAIVREARTAKAVNGLYLDSSGMSNAAAVMFATRILELLFGILRQNDHTIVDPSSFAVGEFTRTCVNGLRSVAASLFAVQTITHVTLLQRLCSLASHPWIKSAIVGRVSVAYDQAIASVESHSYDLGSWTLWPECSRSDVVDVDFDGIAIAAPARSMTPDPSVMHDYVLYSEMAFATGFKADVINSLIDDIWAVKAAADTTMAQTRSAAKQGSGVIIVAGVAPDLPIPGREEVRDLVTLPRHVSGLPILSSYDARSYMLPTTRSYRFLNHDRWRYYTQASLSDVGRETFPLFPIQVTEGASKATMKVVPQVLPLFYVLDESEVPRLPSVATLAHLWQTTVEELRRNIASLSTTAKNPTLRSWADALRFVGVLCVAPVAVAGTIGPGSPVMPSCGHYYHADPIALMKLPTGDDSTPDTCFGRPIDIGPLSGGEAHLILYPFSSVPSCADTSKISDNLEALPLIAVHDHEAAVRWRYRYDALTPIKATSARILGWTFPSSEIADLVLVPMPTGSDQYAELQGDDQFRPSHITPVNAVVSLVTDEDPTVVTISVDTDATAAETTIPTYITQV